MQEQNLTIRRLGLDDYDELLALWQRAGLHSLRPQGRDSRASIAHQLASGVQTILGLEADAPSRTSCGPEPGSAPHPRAAAHPAAALVGAVVATHDSRKGWINRLAVDPDHRRRGHASRLAAAAEEVLREQGMHVIAVLVESDNAASLALFQKAGYVEIDPGIHYLTKRDSDDT